MSKYEIAKMTWEEIDHLDKTKTLLFLPVSPVEEHGPHLPLGTDLFGAQDIAKLGIEILERENPELNYLIYPPIPLGSADITGDFPGTVTIQGGTLMRVIYDILSSLSTSGFKYILIINHHFDILHMKAIAVASEKAQKHFAIKVFEPLGTYFFATEPQPASGFPMETGFDLSKEAHAEFEETSFIKYCYPELLKDSYKDLPPVYIDLIKQYLIGRNTLKKMGAEKGYVGSPSRASAEYGKAYLEEKSRLLADSAMKLYRGDALPRVSLKIRLAMKLMRLG